MKTLYVVVSIVSMLLATACATRELPLATPLPGCKYSGQLERIATVTGSFLPLVTEQPAEQALDSVADLLKRSGFTIQERESGGAVATGVKRVRKGFRTRSFIVRVDPVSARQITFCALWNPHIARPGKSTGADRDLNDALQRLADNLYRQISTAVGHVR